MANFAARVVHDGNARLGGVSTGQQWAAHHDADKNTQHHQSGRKRIRPARNNGHLIYLSSKTIPFFCEAYGQALFTVYPAAAPLSTAGPLWLNGTETCTVTVALLPYESVTLNVIV